MYRAVPSSRRIPAQFARGVVRVTRRRFATESSAPSPTAAPKKSKHILRKIFLTTTALTGTFYVGSTFAAFSNQQYYDFFSDNVPLGQSLLEYAEANHWDKLTAKDVVDAGTHAALSIKHFVTDTINGTSTASPAVESARQAAEKALTESKTRVENVFAELKTNVHKELEEVDKKAVTIAKHQAEQLSEAIMETLRKGEPAKSSEPTPSEPSPPAPTPTEEPVPSVPSVLAEPPVDTNVYSAPLPVGFELPPGYKRPTPPKPPVVAEPAPEPVYIPLVAPAISSLEASASEPIITHLAGTIDNLASYLASNPAAAAKAVGVLETAKTDLTALADRIEKAREEERIALEAKLDEQTREYSLKLMELEMEAQDKLDNQEEGFKKFFEEERARFVQAYRAKLDHELRTQTELINERLKEEVIAQGIELQRRWIREIKIRVEQERGGRLAKLDELSANLKRLEGIALDNSSYLEENIRIHSLWSAIRALHGTALATAERRPFREELRRLRYISNAREDPVIQTVLENLDSSDVPDYGVEPFADLATWFTSKVAAEVSNVALVPEENAGVLSYLASRVLSNLRFKRTGLVEGDDVLSMLARAEYYLNEKDLDSAARELNQLKGAPKLLVHDWLEAARRRLEVQQALEAVGAQATLASLLVI
ncbi:hypothetical protein BDN72DRAFT_789717 [Pluteus cervinus]|uniref:Uncharacterized protein n=1 Tax=Pluteus cervinus TaxID=181527 RepID=A0ACD3B8F1_9AGAR|nr:hypothetical protein BDN72DRAFT_789717 [Pluteus cervinus]